MDSSNFYNPYVLDVKESVFGGFAQPCSSDLENLGQLPVLQDSRVLTIRSYVFSSFLHYLRFRGQGIYFSQFRKATMFGRPRKSRPISGFGGTLGYCRLGLMDFSYFFVNSSFPTSSLSRNLFLAVSRSYHVRVTSKI